MSASRAKKKVVLAFSGGLDTTVILHWLINQFGHEVIAFIADIGQQEDLEKTRRHALEIGASKAIIRDMREEFVKEYIFPMFRANALYEGMYMLGTAIARPLIAHHQIAIAEEEGALSVAHGATGKGNDQVRFEIAYHSLNPNIDIIAPWRDWKFTGRKDLLAYAKREGLLIEGLSNVDSKYSMDANLLHTSYEGKDLEDPWQAPREDMFLMTNGAENAPDEGRIIEICFRQGDPYAVDDQCFSPAEIVQELNSLAGLHGCGRVDMVENRFIGIKSRGIYETPAGTVILAARRALESITLDSGSAHLKDEFMPRYAELIYNGFWFSPERKMIQAAIDYCSDWVEGTVRVKLYKGNVYILGRKSDKSLYSHSQASFDGGDFYPAAATGFIKLKALRLANLHKRR